MSKYLYIDSQKALPANLNSVVKMCRWLTVSTSDFYHWATRQQSPTSARREALTVQIHYFFVESDGTYGYRRIHADLAAEAAANMPNLLKRDFTADRPGMKFFRAATFIHTWQGFIYLATIIDCVSKKVVGWSIADHMRTEFVEDALKNAAATTVIEPKAIWHSDRCNVYTSTDFRVLVTDLAMRSSMGRTGVCWDNSMAETFFSMRKNERVYRTVYATKAQARRDIIRYIEGLYNSRRRHPALGYRLPNVVQYGREKLALAAERKPVIPLCEIPAAAHRPCVVFAVYSVGWSPAREFKFPHTVGLICCGSLVRGPEPLLELRGHNFGTAEGAPNGAETHRTEGLDVPPFFMFSCVNQQCSSVRIEGSMLQASRCGS